MLALSIARLLHQVARLCSRTAIRLQSCFLDTQRAQRATPAQNRQSGIGPRRQLCFGRDTCGWWVQRTTNCSPVAPAQRLGSNGTPGRTKYQATSKGTCWVAMVASTVHTYVAVQLCAPRAQQHARAVWRRKQGQNTARAAIANPVRMHGCCRRIGHKTGRQRPPRMHDGVHSVATAHRLPCA